MDLLNMKKGRIDPIYEFLKMLIGKDLSCEPQFSNSVIY